MQKIALPTGYLFTQQYSKGELETLSIGDYGKAHNVKADFLGYKRELEGVENTACMPLSEKWVITLSTQYGCVMRCKFCDVPNIPFGGNASLEDLWEQFYSAVGMFPEVRYTDRLNIHFARMGEPISNEAVYDFASGIFFSKAEIAEKTGLRIEVIHPVLSTSLPRKYKPLFSRLLQWCDIKNRVYNGQAGLQLSINSTNDEQRNAMFNGDSCTLSEIANMAYLLPTPLGRKYCLNFAYASGNEIDARKLASMFDPACFMVKLTPIHFNNACAANGIATEDGHDSFDAYRQIEQGLKENGFDVLTFIPSLDEEDGLVTCGNAVLGGGVVKLHDNTINIKGIQAKNT